MKTKISFKALFVLVFMIATMAFAGDLDFDVDNDSKIDDAFLDLSWDITGAVKCDGAGDCTQAGYEDLSNYNALDPDYLAGDTTDDNKIDDAVLNLTTLLASLSIDDLVILSGRAGGSQHLGTFTGATIDDNLTMKAALQDLETYVEGLGGGHDPITLGTDLNSNLLGLSTQELTLDSQAANLVFAGPASGGAVVPTFRSLVVADIPDLSGTYEVQLVDEAGLYAALSDVSQFYQPGDTIRITSGTSLPGTCTVGDLHVDTDADSDGTVYFCRATDTWKDIDDDGSAASDVLAKVSSNETDADYLVNQISSTNGEIDVSESGTGDETLMIDIDVTPSAGSATLEISEDALQVKYKAADFSEGADGLEIDYDNGQAAATGVKGFLTGTDWDTFNAKESETHASEHAVGGADSVFGTDPGFDGIYSWDHTAGMTEWGQSTDLSYDGSNWVVVDDSHSHVYSNIDPFTEANLYTLLSDVSQFYESGDQPSFSTVTFADQDASPGVTGKLNYDNTITGLIDGGFVWYDDDEVQLIVSVPLDNFGTGPTDDYIVAYDAINDEHYYMEASAAGGNTKFNLLEDADADGSIAFAGFEQEITSTIDESGGVALTIKHTDLDGLTNDTYLVELIHVNDGDTEAHFIRGLDNTGDELWKIDYQGIATFKSVQTSGSDTPGFTAKDLQNPGADLEIGKLYWNYLSGVDGAEDGGIYLQVMVAGTERTIFEYNADTEEIIFGDSATGEDLVCEFDTGVANQIDCTSTSGVTRIDFSFNIQASQLISDIGAGTAPLLVTSTTKVINLNADQVDGESASEIVTAARVGAASANLDDTDASIEWEDATDLDLDGSITDGAVDFSHFSAGAKFQSLAVAALDDAATPSVLTVAETTNKVISNYKATGADHVFTMPAPHAAGNVIFPIGDEFQVDIEPNTDDLFYLNGTAMAANEHIQNTADTLGERIVGYVVNINGSLTWMFYSSDEAWVEETP